ncbi:MAG: tRNA pseudouridine(38-40) synthase TruA [Proteobacteria bacterium]|nr:tRNA pseudouridine(38-40) synthase TruA [Pseudomonadota bacterium]
MRNIKLTLEYDGTGYHGWQIQPNVKTIQGTVEGKLAHITGEPVRLFASGRTDTGVHAMGQVAHFKTQSSLDVLSFLKALNSLLPEDIRVKDVEEVDEAFHARFGAKGKVYEYRIFNGELPSPFHRHYSWFVPGKLDLANMRKAAMKLRGRHDFSSFCSAGSDHSSRIREIYAIDVGMRGDLVIIEVEANGFLKQMVRNIVGTLVEVGRRKLTPSQFADILEARDRRRAGLAAPAQGLFLVRVNY